MTSRLDLLQFAGLLLSGLVGLSLLSDWLSFEWPLRSLPLALSLVCSAFLYGLESARKRGSELRTTTGWSIARQMVLTALVLLIGAVVLLALAGILSLGGTPFTEIMVSVAEFGFCLLFSVWLCRYAYELGISKGRAVFAAREKTQK